MPVLNVNPNRMELIKLRRRLILARRGHKLLKDKRDELMRIFMEMFEEVYGRRLELEKNFFKAFRLFKYARAQMGVSGFKAATVWKDISVKFEARLKPLLNLRVPDYNIAIDGAADGVSSSNSEGNPAGFVWWDPSYVPLEMEETFIMMKEIIPAMVRLAADEKSLRLLAEEIERTRRRVNALEYVLIPNLIETIRYISMRLSENERSEQVRLMKVKDIVRGH